MEKQINNNPEGIEPGDAVYHVSNKDLIMGVEWVEGDRASCSWVDQKGNHQEREFHLKTLKKVMEDSGASDISMF